MNPKIRKRFAAAIAAQGFSPTTASRAAGLGMTYCRDVIKRERGNLESMERIIKTIGASWDWVLTGREPPANNPRYSHPAAQSSTNVVVSRAALIDVIQAALRLVKKPLTEDEVVALAKVVLSMLEAPEVPAEDDEESVRVPAAPISEIE
jgi:hypothetical protein